MKLDKLHLYRKFSQEYRSRTQSGILYLFEKIIRSHPLLYFISRVLVRFTSIHEEDFEGVKLLNFKGNINILDIGASDGITSKFFSRNLNVRSITCFEPNYHYIKILKGLSIENLIIKPFAIGNKNSFKTIYFPRYKFFFKNLDLITYTHYDRKFLEQQISLDFKFRKNISIIKRKILIKKVKKENKKIDLIKIDTNGFEFPVIRGLMQIIRKDRPAMIVESNQDIKKIDKILKKLSYKSYYFSVNKKKLKLVNKKYPLNTFFLQKKHLPQIFI